MKNHAKYADKKYEINFQKLVHGSMGKPYRAVSYQKDVEAWRRRKNCLVDCVNTRTLVGNAKMPVHDLYKCKPKTQSIQHNVVQDDGRRYSVLIGLVSKVY